jgi:serine/threonine protein phosphatase 1
MPKKRILCISDIHGEYNKFMALLKKVNYNPEEDQLVLHGDYVDRGDQNMACIMKVMELQKLGAVALRGNHEEFLKEAINEMLFGPDPYNSSYGSNLNLWVGYNGGAKTYSEIKNLSNDELDEVYRFVCRLPNMAHWNEYIFVHAGVNSKKPIEQNTKDEFIWSREEFIWCPAYKDKIVIFGHTPTCNLHPYGKAPKIEDSKIWYDQNYKDKIGIDCGSIFGGRLACLELPSMEEYYV